MYYSSVGDCQAALGASREAWDVSHKFALHGLDLLLDFQETFALMVADMPDRAHAALERIRARSTAATSREKPVLELASGLLSLRMRAWDRALERARALAGIGERTGMPAFQIFGHLLAARALEHAGEHGVLRSHLLEAREAGAAARIGLADYVASLVEARLALAAGDRAFAVEWLRRAFALGRDRGFVHHFWFSRAETDQLCALALENAIEPDYARRLIARAAAAGAASDPAAESDPSGRNRPTTASSRSS